MSLVQKTREAWVSEVLVLLIKLSYLNFYGEFFNQIRIGALTFYTLYLQNSSIWDTCPSKRSSLIWKSIFYARDLMKDNAQWLIGNDLTALLRSNWTAGPVFMINACPPTQYNRKVSMLLDDSGTSWDSTKLTILLFQPIFMELFLTHLFFMAVKIVLSGWNLVMIVFQLNLLTRNTQISTPSTTFHFITHG